eukprot:c21967_g2_i6.p1 GENE.c21967_g2_i6~~c21967_g2_i6.p1  ORF type:complete len:676 (-),score=323.43 c21967_g2_i6:1087-3114(-)
MTTIPARSGWLIKHASINGDWHNTKFTSNWKKRFFILKGVQVFYYESPSSQKEKGSFNLEMNTSIEEATVPGKDYCFAVYSKKFNVSYVMQAQNEDTMKDWIEVLKSVVFQLANPNSPSSLPTVRNRSSRSIVLTKVDDEIDVLRTSVDDPNTIKQKTNNNNNTVEDYLAQQTIKNESKQNSSAEDEENEKKKKVIIDDYFEHTGQIRYSLKLNDNTAKEISNALNDDDDDNNESNNFNEKESNKNNNKNNNNSTQAKEEDTISNNSSIKKEKKVNKNKNNGIDEEENNNSNNNNNEVSKRGQKKKEEVITGEKYWNLIVTRVKYCLGKIRREQNLIDVYSREYNADLCKPTQDIIRAQTSIYNNKQKIRELVKSAENHFENTKAIPEAAWADDGIDAEVICCSICGSGEVTPENDILLCDREGCDRGFHQKCLDPPITNTAELPDDWFCPACDCLLDCIELVNQEFDTEFSSYKEMFPEVGDGPFVFTPPTPQEKKTKKRPKNSSRETEENSPESSPEQPRKKRKAGEKAATVVSMLLKTDDTVTKWLEEDEEDQADSDFDITKKKSENEVNEENKKKVESGSDEKEEDDSDDSDDDDDLEYDSEDESSDEKHSKNSKKSKGEKSKNNQKRTSSRGRPKKSDSGVKSNKKKEDDGEEDEDEDDELDFPTESIFA